MREQIPRFLEYMVREKECANNTAAAYLNDLSQFVEYIEGYATPPHPGIESWTDVDDAVLQNYLLYLKERGYASSTVARKVASVKSFFQYLKESAQLPEDPTRKLIPPKVKKNPPRSIRPEDVDRLLAAPGKSHAPMALRDKALMEVLYASGMRVTELVNLNVADVDFAAQSIACGSESKRSRTVPIYPDPLAVLHRYVVDGRPHLLEDAAERALFLNHRGQRLTRQGLWLIIKRYVKQVGIKGTVTPHTLRHSFAMHLLSSGAGLREVQERLGHASPSTTLVYRQAMQEAGAELVVDGRPYTQDG